MSRILKVYKARFRALLRELNSRRLEAGVERLVASADRLSRSAGISRTRGLIRVHERLRTQVVHFSNRPDHSERGATGTLPVNQGLRVRPPQRFFCDAGLGGLARWLRAAGYETIWVRDIEDAELVRQAQRRDATILTTDSLLMERGILRDGVVPGFWLAPTLRIEEQLALVCREFGLALREPRCTKCGGELRLVDKESVRDRIPPRTARWLDEYFACRGCGQLFWRGTHWRRTHARLEKVSDLRAPEVGGRLELQTA